MCSERTVSSKSLSAQCLAKAPVMLRHISDVIAMRVHYNIPICLLKAEKYVHHFNLSLYHKPRLRKDVCCRVGGLDDCIDIFWDVNRRQKVVRRIICVR